MENLSVYNLSEKIDHSKIQQCISQPNIHRDVNEIGIIFDYLFKATFLKCRYCGTSCSGNVKCLSCKCAFYCNELCLLADTHVHLLTCNVFSTLVQMDGFKELSSNYVSLCIRHTERKIAPRRPIVCLVLLDITEQEIDKLPCMDKGHTFKEEKSDTYLKYVSNSIGTIRKRYCGEFVVFIFVNSVSMKSCIDCAFPCNCCDHEECFKRLLK
jgi:hypothetical protein